MTRCRVVDSNHRPPGYEPGKLPLLQRDPDIVAPRGVQLKGASITNGRVDGLTAPRGAVTIRRVGIAICPQCQASGEVHDPRGYHKKRCPLCRGECLVDVEVRRRWMVENGLLPFELEEEVTREPCPSCNPCGYCGGSRFVDPAEAELIRALLLGSKP